MGYRLSPWADYAGYALLAWLLYRTITFYFFPYKTALVRYRRSSGSAPRSTNTSSTKAYALITGASGGIGYGFAQELLSHGFNLILLANNPTKLEKAASTLKSEYAAQSPDIRTISFDGRSGDYDKLETSLKPFLELPITVVINNLGLIAADPAYKDLTEWTAKEIRDTVEGNIGVMTNVSRIMMPTLIKNGPSVMLHMSSGAYIGTPWMAIYGGTKGYVNSFATAMSRESRANGWKVSSIAVVPGDVVSEFNHSPPTPMTPNSRQYAKMTLDRVEMAVDRGLTVISPYWMHALAFGILDKVPESLVRVLFVEDMRQRKNTWSKAK